MSDEREKTGAGPDIIQWLQERAGVEHRGRAAATVAMRDLAETLVAPLHRLLNAMASLARTESPETAGGERIDERTDHE